MDDPNIAAKAKLSPSRREEINARLQRCMSLWGKHDLDKILDEGADVDSAYPRGESSKPSPFWGLTPAMRAASIFGHESQNFEAFPAMRRVLLLCDSNSRDLQGRTPLMHAASNLRLEAVEILAPRSDLLAVCADKGFDAGWPALFFAAHVLAEGSELEKRLCELLAHPAIWSMRSRQGFDALDCAEMGEASPEIIEFLRHLRASHQAQEQARQLREEIFPVQAKPKPAL